MPPRPDPDRRPEPDALTARDGVLALLGPAIVIGLCWLRSPDVLRIGRFWAEDTMFFGWVHAVPTLLGRLGYVYKGHYELLAIVGHTLASYVKPKFAPLVTEAVGLGFEAVLAYVIVLLRRDLGIALAPALALAALLVVSPCASEHYLNVLNGQWLASALLFVLVLLPERRLAGRPVVAGATALVLGLTGVAACALLPVALLYAAARRSQPHAMLAGGLALACLVQGLLIATHPLDSRFLPASPYVYVVAPLLQVGVKHLMGVDAENNLAQWFREGPMRFGAFSPFVLLPLGVLAWGTRRVLRNGLSEESLLLLSFVAVTLLNEAGAIGDRNDMVGVYTMRYFFVPSLIAGLILARAAPVARLGLPHGILALVLLVSGADFFLNSYNASLVTLQHDWRRQVDACRAGPPGPCAIETSPDGFRVEIEGGPG